MSEFIVKITTKGEAFDQDPGHEVARLLDKVAAKLREESIDSFTHAQSLFDINGNDCGRAKYEKTV